jgi:hypothetical protein
MTPGTSLHADWFGAWDDDVMDTWTNHCINRLLNCSGGDLGNGWQLKNFPGFSWDASPRLVNPPSMTRNSDSAVIRHPGVQHSTHMTF